MRAEAKAWRLVSARTGPYASAQQGDRFTVWRSRSRSDAVPVAIVTTVERKTRMRKIAIHTDDGRSWTFDGRADGHWAYPKTSAAAFDTLFVRPTQPTDERDMRLAPLRDAVSNAAVWVDAREERIAVAQRERAKLDADLAEANAALAKALAALQEEEAK